MATEYYYYKNTKGDLFYRRVTPLKDDILQNKGLIEITESEYKAKTHSSLTTAQKQKLEVKRAIAKKKSELAKTDYQAIKFAESWISDEDYAPIKAARQALRDEINELEAELE